ncbi:putative spherulin-1b precursor protein [Lasiodiplodia theobromae]|uniref:Spherulin-1b protein n=1 Tax=Lasiodiplodia theobromae TaxID=45133 RepID=A0A8H7MB29_9PEZI|nr:Spherulin-1b precursor [Lasiodiplodia theobromae]KAF4536297.1 Spherulin-1b precursor [Lasiodiplodia theobromae]KAF9630815.1 putative spherulin-1b precursor protein [Lasiodiplodia theobromae]
MSSTIAKVLIAALAAGVSALPYESNASSWAPSTTSAAAPAPTVDNTALIEKLKDAPRAIDRFKLLLTKDGKGQELLPPDELQKVIAFDFTANVDPGKGKGGALKSAQINNFPILTDLGISTTVGFLGPCGLNTPHTHPRATEFLTLVDGEKLDFGFIVENGLVADGNNAEAAGSLGRLGGAVFPIGSIHYQFNPTCKNATFVATLTNEDPGTSQMAQNFFGLNGDIVQATLGFPEQLDGADLESFKANIPANVALGVEQCLQTCNIPKN